MAARPRAKSLSDDEDLPGYSKDLHNGESSLEGHYETLDGVDLDDCMDLFPGSNNAKSGFSSEPSWSFSNITGGGVPLTGSAATSDIDVASNKAIGSSVAGGSDDGRDRMADFDDEDDGIATGFNSAPMRSSPVIEGAVEVPMEDIRPLGEEGDDDEDEMEVHELRLPEDE